MAILIGHASLGSNGKISGDIPGDQNGKEVCTRQWYSKPWSLVLRPLDPNVAEKSAKACEAGCANPVFGYNQLQRNTAYTQAKKVGYDLSKVTTLCETDCSAFMTLCAIAGGVKELEYTGNAPTTRTMANAFVKTGKYEQLTDLKYLTSDKYLKRGDILVKPGSHTAMALENGSETEQSGKTIPITKSTKLSYPCRGVDVAAWQPNLDYQKLSDANIKFAILKIIDKNGNTDKMFEKHYDGFTKTNIPVIGVYNYAYFTTVEAAKVNAAKVVKCLNGRKTTVYLDVEDKTLINLGAKMADICNGYQKVIEGAGLSFGIYTGLSFYNSYLRPHINKINCKNYWIARYYNGHNEMSFSQLPNEVYKPLIPNLVGWQYTSSLRVSGSPTVLDASIMYSPVANNKDIGIRQGIVTANSLRVRNQPNQQSETVGYLKKGESVNIYGVDIESGWYQIGQGQYVSNAYINLI